MGATRQQQSKIHKNLFGVDGVDIQPRFHGTPARKVERTHD